MSSSRQPQGTSITPFITVVAVLGALAATWFRFPGALVLLLGLTFSAWFAVAPSPTSSGAILTVKEIKADQRWRVWSELKWKLAVPNHDWLVNPLERFKTFSLRGKIPPAILASVPALKFAGDALGAVIWMLLPARFIHYIAFGAAAVVFTLPTDGLNPDLVWLNALAAFSLVVQLDATIRRHASPDDPSAGVALDALRGRDKRNIVGLIALAAILSAGAFLAIMYARLDWLIVPLPLAIVGLFVALIGTFLHLFIRKAALQPWRNTIAARNGWRPKWDGLKQSPYLIKHERLGEEEVPVDMFEAPGILGSAGAIALQPKLLPFMGSGVKVAMLSCPDLDSDGQPVPGTKHPSQFRAITWKQDAFPDVNDPATPADVLSAFLESAVYWAMQSVQQFQPILLDVRPIFEAATSDDTEEPATAAYASRWALTETMAAIALAAGKGPIAEIMNTETYVDDPDGESTLYFGAVTEDSTTLQDPELLDRLTELGVEARWEQRWQDLLKVGEKPPVIQYTFYKEAKLNATTTIYSQPFMVKQGLDPTAFFNAYVKKGLATTLTGAPFVTVTGYAANSLRPGDRHPQAFTVLWSAQPIPTSPSEVPPAADKDAAKWALAGAVNDGFDAAKLPRPEVVSAKPLTSKDGFTHIWKITLRLYDGVTAAIVKSNTEKIRLAMGSCAWVRVTESIDGCDIYAGADPKTAKIEFAKPQQQNRDLCIALDWEQAFIDAKVVSPADGSAPKLVKAGILPTNEKVQVLEFTIPRGLHPGIVRENRTKLIGATGNAFIEVRAGRTPETFTLLACPENPMPFPARFDWEAIAATTTIPMATGVEGEAVEYDITIDPHLLILGATGSGKAQPLDILLPVPVSDKFPTGWARNDELSVGDSVLTPSGQATGIVGFTEARPEPVYVLTLDDGQEIRASGHHMWKVSTRRARNRDTPSVAVGQLIRISNKLAEASRLELLAREVGPEVGSTITNLARLTGYAAATIQRMNVIEPALARLILEQTAHKASVFEMQTIADHMRSVVRERGVFTFCGRAFTQLELDDLAIDGAWLSARGATEALLGRLSTRKERDRAKAMIQRAKPNRRAGFERRLVTVYPTDEVLSLMAARIRRMAEPEDGEHFDILTTEAMYNQVKTGSGHSNFAIPLTKALEGQDADLLVPPYLLGAWLGDGTSAVGGITVGAENLEEMTSLLSAEWVMPNRIESSSHSDAKVLFFGRKDPSACQHGHRRQRRESARRECTACEQPGNGKTYINATLGHALGHLGLTTPHGGKRIPAQYLRASFDQRLALLQGLMDTDGTISKTGACELTLCNEALITDALELIRSLGIKASMTAAPATITEIVDGIKSRRVVGMRWRVNFTTVTPVFRLDAKSARLPTVTRQTVYRLYVSDIRIEAAAPQRCIRVTDPSHLYLTNGFVATHNSAAIQNVLTVAIMRGWDVYLADPTKLAADFRYAEPWMKAISVDDIETSAMMDYVYEEVKKRRAINGKYGVASYRDLPPEIRPPHVVIFVDEFTSLMVADTLHKPASGASEKELQDFAALQAINSAKNNIGAKAARIAREARSTGFTLVLAGQELKAETLKAIPGGGSLKNNMSSVIIGKASFGSLMSALKAPTEAPDLGDAVPRGRGIFESSASKPKAIQFWYDEDHINSMVSHIVTVRPPLTPEEKADLTPFLHSEDLAPVFGEKITGDDVDDVDDEPVETFDLGELDINFDAIETDSGTVDNGLAATVDLDSAIDASGPALDLERYSVRESVIILGTLGTAELEPELRELPADVLSFDGTDRAPERGIGWWKLDNLAEFMDQHPEVERIAWVDAELADLDDIGVQHSVIAEELAARAGIELLALVPSDDPPSDLEAIAAFLNPSAPARTAVSQGLFDEPEIAIPTSTISFD